MPVKLICDLCKVDLARTPDFRLVCNNCHCDAAHATIKERDKLNDELDRLKAELRQWRTTGFAPARDSRPAPAPPDGATIALNICEHVTQRCDGSEENFALVYRDDHWTIAEARHELSGDGARAWLDRLPTNACPECGTPCTARVAAPAPPDGARRLLAMIEQAAGHYSACRYDQDRVRRHALVEAALIMGLDREAVRTASGLPTLPEED